VRNGDCNSIWIIVTFVCSYAWHLRRHFPPLISVPRFYGCPVLPAFFLLPPSYHFLPSLPFECGSVEASLLWMCLVVVTRSTCKQGCHSSLNTVAMTRLWMCGENELGPCKSLKGAWRSKKILKFTWDAVGNFCQTWNLKLLSVMCQHL